VSGVRGSDWDEIVYWLHVLATPHCRLFWFTSLYLLLSYVTVLTLGPLFCFNCSPISLFFVFLILFSVFLSSLSQLFLLY
jgi:hypothetical protein